MPRRDHGPAERPCQTSEAFDLAMLPRDVVEESIGR